MRQKSKIHTNVSWLLLGLLSIVCVQCDITPDPVEVPMEVAEMQIMQYLESDSSRFYEFQMITESVNLSGILSTRGPFTLFLPDNDALLAYYDLKGKNSYTDFTPEELTDIVRYHIIAAEIATSDIQLGALSERNALGDYLVSEFDESDIVINKESYITDRDIYVANGVIHEIDKVIDPVVDGSYSVIEKHNEFSIFTAGLELSGLKDTLDLVDIPYGLTTARVRYTILAVPDSIYKENGINSINDLVSQFDDGVGSLTDLDNGFFKYIDYHILENTYYLSSIETGVYFIASRNNYLYLEVGSEFLINPIDSAEFITTFIDKHSNIPTKNGVIHGINQVLPATDPEPQEFIFDTNAFPEFQKLDIYETGGVRNFYDNETGFAKIKWTGDYLQYWKKFQGTGFVNDDCITMSEGFWELEITMPKVARGTYNVYGYFKKGSNRANVIFYIDDDVKSEVIELNGPQEYVSEYIGQVTWDKTEEHVVRVKTVYPGVIMWDRLNFIPPEIDPNN